jgi:hypothetical protein
MEFLLAFTIRTYHDAWSCECQSPSTAVIYQWGKNVISYDNDNLTNLTETSTGFKASVSVHTYIHTYNCACYVLQRAAEAAAWLV